MATIEDMKNVLKDTLEERGVLSELRAKLRMEIFNSLNDKPVDKPKLSNENLIINELIREYLIFNNYAHSLSVFLPETGQPDRPPFDRSYITKKLNIQEDNKTKELPLLYGLAFGLKQLVVENETGVGNENMNTNMNYTMPKRDQIYTTKKLESESKEPKSLYQDIFNVNNPKPFSYKPE